MRRVMIFGNSGSGKSTLAKALATELGCAHLDLDTIAWQPDQDPPLRKSPADCAHDLAPFLTAPGDWVVEGCYADLLELLLPAATRVVFLNPGVETCINNCRNRPWEPHKYPSPEAQDANLEMLISWIRQYDQRHDEFSLKAHRELFQRFDGVKREVVSNHHLDLKGWLTASES